MSGNVIDFDAYGSWNPQTLIGPAIHAPDAIKAIVVDKYRVERMNLSVPDLNLYAKKYVRDVNEVGSGHILGSNLLNLIWIFSTRNGSPTRSIFPGSTRSFYRPTHQQLIGPFIIAHTTSEMAQLSAHS
jgi:hypothetical protein